MKLLLNKDGRSSRRSKRRTSTPWSAIDGRTMRHIGYAISQICRKAVDGPFG